MDNTETREVFEALCAHAKANGAKATMTRAELQKAAGLSEEEFMATLHLLHPPGQDSQVRFIGGDSGEVAICTGGGWDDYQRQRDCVADFQRQGWERVPE